MPSGRLPQPHYFARGEFPLAITEAGGMVFMTTSKGVYIFRKRDWGAEKDEHFEPVAINRTRVNPGPVTGKKR